jgi:hypothetical protein
MPIMRAVLVAAFCALMCPAAVLAQTVAMPVAPARGGDITRDQYIEHAVERAKRAAEARFDRMDTDHDGVLTAAERRAARAQRRAAPSQ